MRCSHFGPTKTRRADCGNDAISRPVVRRWCCCHGGQEVAEKNQTQLRCDCENEHRLLRIGQMIASRRHHLCKMGGGPSTLSGRSVPCTRYGGSACWRLAHALVCRFISTGPPLHRRLPDPAQLFYAGPMSEMSICAILSLQMTFDRRENHDEQPSFIDR